jgi:TonB family protein
LTGKADKLMNFTNTIGFLLLILIGGLSPTFAQIKFCPLDLSVIQFQENQTAGEIPIGNSIATATNLATKKTFKASLFEGMPRFAKLPEGKYDVTVTKVGFRRTVKPIEINCSGLDDDGSITEIIYLWKGSSKQLVKMPGNKTIIGTTNEPSSQPTTASKIVNAGIVNNNSVNLVIPEYPPAARAVKAMGAVNIQVTIDERGDVISASAVSGHPLLRQAAEKAARESKFSPTMLSGIPVKVTGIIVYNFVP